MSEVVVLGAGPAGLIAALEAARTGHRCTVFEAADHVGGMAASFDVAGQRVDFGSHRLHPATPAPLLAVLSDLLGPDLQRRQRAGRLRFADRWVAFPLRFTDLVLTMPPRLSAQLATDSIRASLTGAGPRSGPDVRSFHDDVVARLGPTVAAELYDPYARKLYGTAAELLHPELARRRVSAASPSDIARRLVRATRSEGRTFLYPRRGYGQIADVLAEAAVAAGATIELSSPVSSIEVERDHVRVTAGRHIVDGDVALSTIPLPILASVTKPAPPRAVRAALSELRTRGMVLVYLVVDRPRYTSYDAHYLPALDTRVSRLSEPKNYRDGDDPADRTVLCAEIPCWPGDGWWSRPATELGELVAEDLARAGLPPIEASQVVVRRLPSVYPVFDLAGTAARATVADWTAMSGRLVTLGRQGLGVIDNLHHVLAMGTAAVRSMEQDGVDGARWRHHLDAFTLHTVED